MRRRTFLGWFACAIAAVTVFGLGCAPTKYTEVMRFKIGAAEAGHRLHGVLFKECGKPALRCPVLLDDGTSGYLVAGFSDITANGYSFDPASPFCHEIFRVTHVNGEERFEPLATAWHRIEVVDGEEYVLVVSDAQFTKSRRQQILDVDRLVIEHEEAWGISVRA